MRWSYRRSTVRHKLVWFLKQTLKFLGIGITSFNNLSYLQGIAIDSSRQDLEFLKTLKTSKHELILNLLTKSRSQLRQDLFVLSETDFKKNGYFVEFGATNGVELSNTYLLETEFSWTGILAEPANAWKAKLRENRPDARIEDLCVWSDSVSTLMFNETEVPELSTLDSFSNKDDHRAIRKEGKKYEVKTISLNDLLKKHLSPRFIDYLSIDTEGSEFEILKAFDFNSYHIGIITVEHNNTPNRERIFELLTHYGYRRKYESISHFDDWYIKT